MLCIYLVPVISFELYLVIQCNPPLSIGIPTNNGKGITLKIFLVNCNAMKYQKVTIGDAFTNSLGVMLGIILYQ